MSRRLSNTELQCLAAAMIAIAPSDSNVPFNMTGHQARRWLHEVGTYLEGRMTSDQIKTMQREMVLQKRIALEMQLMRVMNVLYELVQRYPFTMFFGYKSPPPAIAYNVQQEERGNLRGMGTRFLLYLDEELGLPRLSDGAAFMITSSAAPDLYGLLFFCRPC
jgi:hypothetical protein